LTEGVLMGQRGMGGSQCLSGACGYWGALREGGSTKNGQKEMMRLVVAGVKGSWQAGGGRLGKTDAAINDRVTEWWA